MSADHKATTNFGDQHTTAAMAPQDTYQSHDNGPSPHSRRGSSMSKIEHNLSSSSSEASLSDATNSLGSKRALTAPPSDQPALKKHKVTHRLVVPNGAPLKDKPIDAYRDAIEEPLGYTKEENGKCLTCIKHNRACKGTIVADRHARGKTSKRCTTCMPKTGAHCGRHCYWKDPANGIYTYDQAQDFHKGIRNPKNSRDGRHMRAQVQQGTPIGSAGLSAPYGPSNASSGTAGPFSPSGFTAVNGQASGTRQPVPNHNDVSDSDDSDDDDHDNMVTDTDEQSLQDQITALLEDLKGQARIDLRRSMPALIPSDAQIYFGTVQALIARQHGLPEAIYNALRKRLHAYHSEIAFGPSSRLTTVHQLIALPHRGAAPNMNGASSKGKDKA